GIKKGTKMIQVQNAILIHATSSDLFSIYMDYNHWNKLFPLTIRGVKFIKRENNTTTVEVEHKAAGSVINILSVVSNEEIKLEEFKPVYNAVFINHFKKVDDDT